jgi:hypothetical protein
MHAPASRCHGTEAASLCTVSCWVCQQIRLTFNGFGGPAQGEKWPPTKNAAPGRGTPEGRAATLPGQHLWSEAWPRVYPCRNRAALRAEKPRVPTILQPPRRQKMQMPGTRARLPNSTPSVFRLFSARKTEQRPTAGRAQNVALPCALARSQRPSGVPIAVKVTQSASSATGSRFPRSSQKVDPLRSRPCAEHPAPLFPGSGSCSPWERIGPSRTSVSS